MARHVIFGAGQVGTTLAEQLARAGEHVEVVSRSARNAPAGAVAVRADASDRAECMRVAQGATVLYHCMTPPYSTAVWEQVLPVWQENLIAAAAATGARLVVLENLYAFGAPAGRISEATPHAPRSRKGSLRARIDERWLDAHRRGEAAVVLGHASDFFGPRGTQTMFDERFWRRVLSGKSAQVIVNPDTPHTYHYIPDVASGLASLAAAPEDAYGTGWMLPCAPAVTTREIIGLFGAALGRPVRVEVVPAWLRKTLELFVPIIREVGEMRYQWEHPFIVDDSRFRARFGGTATHLDTAARETVQWAGAQYGQAQARG